MQVQSQNHNQQPQRKLKAAPGQAVGPSGATLSPQICKGIIEAVKAGDREKLRLELMRYNIEVRDVVDIGQFNQNLCFSACQASDEEAAMNMLELLVSMGVDLFTKDNLKQTPLYYASKSGHLKLIQLLIEQGINVNQIDTYGQNAIYYAITAGNLQATHLLKSYGSEHDTIDENGQTPIYYAIKANKLDLIEYLLQLGCNLNNVDKRG